ncbi:MAG: hypothetical protein CR979_02915, partial [Propionibacterium sp.]
GPNNTTGPWQVTPWQGSQPGAGQWQVQVPVPSRQRSKVKTLFLVVFFIIVGLVFFARLASSAIDSDRVPPQPEYSPAAEETTEPVEAEETPAPLTNYENDAYQVPPPDLNPPPIPIPKRLSTARSWLVNNDLYNQRTPRPIRCELGNIDMRSASNKQIERHLNKAMACMMRTWGPTLDEAGFVAVRPSITVYSRPISNRCGTTDMGNAQYCTADQQVYVASDLLQRLMPSRKKTRFVGETILAHEFGHAIQARSGIFASEFIFEDKARSKKEKNNLSRRLEMQADCFAGLFIGSIAESTKLKPAEAATLVKLAHSMGDDVLSGRSQIDGNHGLGKNRKYWLKQGLHDDKVSVCNTFTANANQVR